MSARLSEQQLEQALQACVPTRSPVGSADRLFETIATTRQDRPLPMVLAQLRDVDPLGRRRSLLIAAALLLALAVASATAIGAWRLLQRGPLDDLSLEAPTDLPAFVLSSYERLPQLPPVALTWRASDSTKGRIYVDQSGAVRFDQFASPDAAEPSTFRVLSGNRISGVASVGSDKVWVEDDGAIENPREWIRGVLGGQAGPPGCEMERDPSVVADGSVATGWRYVGLEYVAGRPALHVACAGELWIDIETRLILRTRQPQTDEAGQPVSGQFVTTEVTEIAFGQQPAALFQGPEGMARMSSEEYTSYICARGLPNELVPGISDCPSAEATPPPQPSPTPAPTERPNTSGCAVQPGDLSERSGPLAWSRASLKEDWPAPVRPEPARGGNVQPMHLTYLDPMRDTGSDAFPCVDIRWVMANTNEVHLRLDSSQAVVDPADAWIAYGVVTDDDGDGVPDWRYGIDNMPADLADAGPLVRAWRTDLHTGRTEAGPEHDEAVRSAYGEGTPRGRAPRSVYPRYGSDGSDAGFLFGGTFETTQGPSRWGFEMDVPFYAWASVIVDGRVVATDYAPDTGWLVSKSGSNPAGTYRLGDPFPDLSMTVPEGWTTSSTSMSTRFGRPGDLRRVSCGDLPRDFPGDQAYDADCARFGFEVINDPEDPCLEPIGSTDSNFDDLVTDVARQLGRKTTRADVTIGGHRGKHLANSSVKDAAFYCHASPYEEVWILDVDGVALMIGSHPDGDLPLNVPRGALKAEIRKMLESIHFER